MAGPLIDRYTFGTTGWISPLSIEADILLRGPDRERQMLRLAQLQIEAQDAARRDIVRSQIAGAQIVAAEITQQTEAFESAVTAVGDQISHGISRAADQISYAIDALGDRICAELTEIQWQLAQQNERLEKVLDVLRNSRNNEAQQLVRQGVRHYVNGQYNQAEERFRRALEYDTTDYQVLLNLGHIEIHKGDPAQALAFFNNALHLPERLDSSSRSRALWAMARLCYAQGEYKDAYAYATHAAAEMAWRPEDKYKVGVYAALADEKSVALENIKKAVLADPRYISRATVEPDLQTIRQDVLSLLAQISQEALNKARHGLEEAERKMPKEAGEEASEYCDGISKVRCALAKAHEALKNPSYSDCLRCTDNMRLLREAIASLSALGPIFMRRRQINEQYMSAKKQAHEMYQRREYFKNLTDRSRSLGCLAVPLAYCVIGMSAAMNEPNAIAKVVAFLLWPVLIVVDLVWVIGRLFCAALIIGLIWGFGQLCEMSRKETDSNLDEVRGNRDRAWANVADDDMEIERHRNAFTKCLSNIRW